MRFLTLVAATAIVHGGCKKDDDETDTLVVDTDTDTTDTDTVTETDTVDTVETDAVDSDTVDTDTDMDTDTEVKFDVTVNGTGFEVFDGKNVALAIHDLAKFKFAGAEFGLLAGGSFSLTATEKVLAGLEYSVDYFVDVNGNMLCDPEDAAFHLEIPAVTADVVMDVTFNPAAVDLVACKAF